MDVKGKIAIVTGSATGVGRATALQLADLGCGVVVNYSRSEAEARQTYEDVKAKGVPALLVQADVADDAAVRAMVQRTIDELGGVDVLVNNAGTTTYVDHDDLEGLTGDVWDRTIDVNLKGSFYCIRAVAPSMKARGAGAIVNVASIAGVQGGGSSVAYGAAKAGVINMTKDLAKALGPEIRINAISPGFIEGRWQASRLGENYESFLQRARERMVLKKTTTPEDVAQLILSLICGADLVTGQNIVIDAGGRA